MLPLILLAAALPAFSQAPARPKAAVAPPAATAESVTAAAPVVYAPVRKKLVYVGFDSPTSKQFRRDLAVMREPAVDGFVVWAEANGDFPNEVGKSPFRRAFSSQPWKRSWFTQAVADLKAGQASNPRFTENFLRLDANPGDVDWFDDAGWSQVVDHFRIAAWITRGSGLRGIIFDAEPYMPPYSQFSFAYQAGRGAHSFLQYRAQARQRGRQVMGAIAAENPHCVLQTMFLLSYLTSPHPWYGGDTPTGRQNIGEALVARSYNLLPDFLNGMLDVMPPTIKMVDGDELGYYASAEADYWKLQGLAKSRALDLIAPENYAKYRAQVLHGFGIYIDAHKTGLVGTLTQSDPTPEAFEKHLGTALRVADEYVWLYGEGGRWWPAPGDTVEWAGKVTLPEWETLFPGATGAVKAARDPEETKRLRAVVRAAGRANLLKNADFSAADPDAGKTASGWNIASAPAQWSSWQSDEKGLPQGVFAWNRAERSLRVTGIGNGCFIQGVAVKAGATYLVEAQARWVGDGVPILNIGWKDSSGKFLPSTFYNANDLSQGFLPPPARAAEPARTVRGVVTVPPGATILLFTLGVSGEVRAADACWWTNPRVVELP